MWIQMPWIVPISVVWIFSIDETSSLCFTELWPLKMLNNKISFTASRYAPFLDHSRTSGRPCIAARAQEEAHEVSEPLCSKCLNWEDTMIYWYWFTDIDIALYPLILILILILILNIYWFWAHEKLPTVVLPHVLVSHTQPASKWLL